MVATRIHDSTQLAGFMLVLDLSFKAAGRLGSLTAGAPQRVRFALLTLASGQPLVDARSCRHSLRAPDRVAGHEGWVVEVVMPSSAVFGTTIEKVTHHPRLRVAIDAGVPYDASIAQTHVVLQNAAESIALVLNLDTSFVDRSVGQSVIEAVALGAENLSISLPELDVRPTKAA